MSTVPGVSQRAPWPFWWTQSDLLMALQETEHGKGKQDSVYP
jgi:hypothetical protein